MRAKRDLKGAQVLCLERLARELSLFLAANMRELKEPMRSYVCSNQKSHQDASQNEVYSTPEHIKMPES